MTYSEIMIYAYATEHGISRKEAIQCLKRNGLIQEDEEISIDQDSDPRTKEILKELRKD